MTGHGVPRVCREVHEHLLDLASIGEDAAQCDVITLDFMNTGLDAGARAGVEITLDSAKALRAALDRAIAAAEFEEAEVRGKGVVLNVVRAA